MKNTFFFVFLCLVCSHQSFSLNKSDFDITEQSGLFKTGGIQTIYNYGNYLYRAEKTEISLITGGYFTIGTNKGQSVSDFDNNCGHPYALTSYPVIGIDGNWGKFDEIHSSLTNLSPNKIQDTLQVSFDQDNIVEIFFQMISGDNGEFGSLVEDIYNLALKIRWGVTSVEAVQEISSETTITLVEPDFSAPVFLRWEMSF